MLTSSAKDIKVIKVFNERVKHIKEDALRTKGEKDQADAAASEMSNMIKNHVWKKMGQHSLALTGKSCRRLLKDLLRSRLRLCRSRHSHRLLNARLLSSHRSRQSGPPRNQCTHI